MDDKSSKVNILGVMFDNVTMQEAVEHSLEIVASGGQGYVVTPNPEIVMMARKDAALMDALAGAALTLPDGAGITLAARMLKTPLRERVPGIDFAAALLEKAAHIGCRVYLLGAAAGVAEEAGRRLAEKHPGLVVCGASDGYFTDSDVVVEAINALEPDILFVGLGAPKQELWMAGNIERLATRLCVGLGGSLDVFAGNAKRAPKPFRALGLEWLYRLARQPRRITRVIKLPLFLFAVIRRAAARRGSLQIGMTFED
jgi:N-acetylglucosaminyldiphosphoundecaprenol N-acetyl-beta-D-mannosaminyltransferase